MARHMKAYEAKFFFQVHNFTLKYADENAFHLFLRL